MIPFDFHPCQNSIIAYYFPTATLQNRRRPIYDPTNPSHARRRPIFAETRPLRLHESRPAAIDSTTHGRLPSSGWPVSCHTPPFGAAGSADSAAAVRCPDARFPAGRRAVGLGGVQ